MIDIFPANATKPIATIRGVDHVSGLAFDNDDTLFVLTSFPGRLGPPGTYVFRPHTDVVVRSYTFGTYEAAEDMAVIPAGTLK